MCGIAGFFINGDYSNKREIIKKMNDMLSHRGPDGEGFYSDDYVLLSHKRLSIIDLNSRSNQPFTDENKQCVITFNGEIYNYIELRKILLETEYEKIESINIEKILGFVESIEVQNEKTSSSKYIGTLAIKFSENKVLKYLSQNNIKFTIIKSKPLLILPIYKFAGVTYLWEKKNIWRNVWIDKSKNVGLIPIKSSEGKFKDFIYFNPDKAVKKNLNNLELLAKSHNTTGVLIAILKKKYNRDKSKMLFNLNLSIHRFDDNETIKHEDIIEIYTNEYSDNVLDDAKIKVEQFVNQQWKTANIITSQKKFQKITVLFNNLNEWIDIKKTISDMSIIDKYNVKKFSHNKATIFLSFSGNLNQLKVAFKQSDLDFNINDNKLNLLK